MIELLPGPHVDIGFVFIGRFEGRENKIKDQKEKANRRPGDGKCTECCGLHLGVGVHEILEYRNQIRSEDHRIEAGQYQGHPEGHEYGKEAERPEQTARQIDSDLAPEALPNLRRFTYALKVTPPLCPISGDVGSL